MSSAKHRRGQATVKTRQHLAFHDPVLEVYLRDVDRTLLRENLKLTPRHIGWAPP